MSSIPGITLCIHPPRLRRAPRAHVYWSKQGHAAQCITFPIPAPAWEAGCSDCDGLVLHTCQEGVPGMSNPELHAAGTTQR